MSTLPPSGSPYACAPQAPAGPYTTSAPSYVGQPAAVPGVKGKKGPLTLIIIGTVFLVAAAVVLCVSVASVARASGTLSQIQSNGSVTAELETASIYGLYSDDQAASTCTVTDPDGAEVPVITVHSSIELNDHTLVATFIPTVPGSYTVTCAASGSEPIFLGEATNAAELGRMIIGVIGSILGGTLGAGLLISGLVWLLVRHSRNRRLLQAQVMAPGYPQPGYPQPGYPQPGSAPSSNGQWRQP